MDRHHKNVLGSLFTAAILLCCATDMNAASVVSQPIGTVKTRTLSGGPDYGEYSYIYAPAVMRIGGNTECWLCNGLAVQSESAGGDHVAFTRNWGIEETVLCPKFNNTRVPVSLCSGMYRQGFTTTRTGDYNGACDPTVVKVGSTYYMYYTADIWGGMDNQMFLATSTDGRNWMKYPNNATPATAVIPFSPNGKYGVGEGSVVYKDGVFYLYYTDFAFYSSNTVKRSTSTDGVSFTAGIPILAETTIPWASEGTGGVDVRYISGWNAWLMVTPTYDKQHLTWNMSRDGIHWLPWSGPFGHQTRLITLPRRFATAPGLESDQHGHIGNGQLTSTQSARLYFTAGDSRYIAGCADAQSAQGSTCVGGITLPMPPDEPAGFWQWTVDATDLTIATQQVRGYLDTLHANQVVSGWSYDPDAGTNNASANGGPAGPLGHDTWVCPIAFHATTGQRYEGAWQSAANFRADLVSAGATPDPYHGFSIDLKTQGFPAGTYRIRIEGGEFPVGMGARELTGEFTVMLP